MRRTSLGLALSCFAAGCFTPDVPSHPIGQGLGSTDGAGETAESDGTGGAHGTGDTEEPPASASSSNGGPPPETGGPATTGDPGDSGDPSGSESGELDASGDSGGELCGNGDVDEGEECDLGASNSDSGACTDTCRLAVCGDGLVRAGFEDCDDAGESAACNVDCTTAQCGDGTLNATAGEICDGETIAHGSCEACQIACAADWMDCGGGIADGCEVDGNIDLDHCGACGNACGGAEVCSDGACLAFKRVFLSSWVVWADFGGVEGADEACQAMADDAGLDGTFMAWVSSIDQQAVLADRFTHHDGPYVLMDGTPIADDWDDLTDGTIAAAIVVDEYGNAPAGFVGGNCHGGATCTQVFTGATAAGGAYNGQHADCDGWSTTTYLPAFAGGDASATDQGWSLFAAGLRCDYAARLYCFEQ